jgi:hypothetical protein
MGTKPNPQNLKEQNANLQHPLPNLKTILSQPIGMIGNQRLKKAAVYLEVHIKTPIRVQCNINLCT